MDVNTYKNAIEYEQLTQSIYQAIVTKEAVHNIKVEHDVKVIGCSGVTHQIDVLWRFEQAGIEHTVLIECKNFASNLTLEKVRNFYGVLHDIGNAQGIIVTKTGFQSGTAKFAKYYGIGLKILRKPTSLDWEGRIKNINMTITAKSVISSSDKPLSVQVIWRPKDEMQRLSLEKLQQNGQLKVSCGPDLCLVDEKGEVCSEEMRWWLPKQLETLDKEAGGPYTQDIKLEDKYILVNEGEEGEQLVAIDAFQVTYFVEVYSEEIVSYGEEIVDAILKDFNTDNIEYVKRNW